MSSKSNLIVTIVCTIFTALKFFSLNHASHLNLCDYAGAILLAAGFVFPNWILEIMVLSRSIHCGYYRAMSHKIQPFVFAFGTLGIGLGLISTTFDEMCSRGIQFWYRQHCFHVPSTVEPNYYFVTLMCPVLLWVLYEHPRPESVAITWIISLFSIVIAVSISAADQVVWFPLYSVFIGLALYDAFGRSHTELTSSSSSSSTKESNRDHTMSISKVEAQTEILKQIIANVTHDLLTPLQALEMGIETMQSIVTPTSSLLNPGCEENESLELLQSMRGTLSLMTMIVRRCMDVFQASDGSMLVAHYDTFAFAQSVSKVGRFMADMQSRIRIDIKFMRGMTITTLRTDQRWFEDNMLCMLSNAVKFAREIPGVNTELRVYVSERVDPRGKLRRMLTVEVWDSGTAIGEEARKTLFLRPASEGRNLMGGAGLGLFSMAKRVEALGGQVGYRPRNDGKCEGSIFWFAVPSECSTVASTPRGLKTNRVLPYVSAKSHSLRVPAAFPVSHHCTETAGTGAVGVGVGAAVEGARVKPPTAVMVLDHPITILRSNTIRNITSSVPHFLYTTSREPSFEDYTGVTNIYDSIDSSSHRAQLAHSNSFHSIRRENSHSFRGEMRAIGGVTDGGAGSPVGSRSGGGRGEEVASISRTSIFTRIPSKLSWFERQQSVRTVYEDDGDVEMGTASGAGAGARVSPTTCAAHGTTAGDMETNTGGAAAGSKYITDTQGSGGSALSKEDRSMRSRFDYSSDDSDSEDGKMDLIDPVAAEHVEVEVEYEDHRDAKSVAAAPAASPAEPMPLQLSILVVDDSISIMKIMSMIMKRAGHTVEQAIDGRVGVEMMKREEYDVVLLDMQMPIMDGYMAVAKFREYESAVADFPGTIYSDEAQTVAAEMNAPRISLINLAVPVLHTRSRRQLVIAMSANSDIESRLKALNSGADAFLPKPFSQGDMTAIVREHLKATAIKGMRKRRKIVNNEENSLLRSETDRDTKSPGPNSSTLVPATELSTTALPAPSPPKTASTGAKLAGSERVSGEGNKQAPTLFRTASAILKQQQQQQQHSGACPHPNHASTTVSAIAVHSSRPAPAAMSSTPHVKISPSALPPLDLHLHIHRHTAGTDVSRESPAGTAVSRDSLSVTHSLANRPNDSAHTSGFTHQADSQNNDSLRDGVNSTLPRPNSLAGPVNSDLMLKMETMFMTSPRRRHSPHNPYHTAFCISNPDPASAPTPAPANGSDPALNTNSCPSPRTHQRRAAASSEICTDPVSHRLSGSKDDVYLINPATTAVPTNTSVDTSTTSKAVSIPTRTRPARPVAPDSQGTTAETGRPLSILIVEDSLPIMKAMSMNLTRSKHSVDKAVNGALGLAAMTKRRYDVVMMDLQMPEMGGCEAVRLLRQFEAEERLCRRENITGTPCHQSISLSSVLQTAELEKLKDTLLPLTTVTSTSTSASIGPGVAQQAEGGETTGRVPGRQLVIGMSANVDADTQAQALASGMDAFVPKPFRIETMLRVVAEKMRQAELG